MRVNRLHPRPVLLRPLRATRDEMAAEGGVSNSAKYDRIRHFYGLRCRARVALSMRPLVSLSSRRISSPFGVGTSSSVLDAAGVRRQFMRHFRVTRSNGGSG
jgi:hypothetical protein